MKDYDNRKRRCNISCMKIATYNVNSIRARLPLVLDWLKTAQPDVACLQEIKCQDH